MSFLSDDWSGEGVGRDVAAALARVDDAQLETSIVSLKARIDAAEAELALRVAEYDRRGAAMRRHILTTKQWLGSRLRLGGSAAASLVRVGRSLSVMDGLIAGALGGRVPFGSVRAVTAVRDRHPVVFESHGHVLVEAAESLSVREVRRAAEHWEQHVAPEVAFGEVGERFARRRLSVNQTFDGMWALQGDLDPESGHVVATAVRAVADPGSLDPDDARSPGQRRADALTDVCRFWLDHNDSVVTSGGVKPHVTVTVDYDQLDPAGRRLDDPRPEHDQAGTPDDGVSEAAEPSRRPESSEDGDGSAGRRGRQNRLDGAGVLRPVLPEIDGTPIASDDVRRLACDSDIVRMVTTGESEVLDVGRATRTIPTAIRRALDHRDGGCTFGGCDAPVGWCDAHHIDHWIDGGSTSLDNLRLLCRRHHRYLHDTEANGTHRADRAPPPEP